MAAKKSGKKQKKSLWYSITHVNKLNRKEYVDLIHRVTLFIVLGFLASVLVFAAIAIFGGVGKVLYTIDHANLLIYSLAFVSVLVSYLLRFIKWSYYLRKLKLKVPKGKSLMVYLSLYSMNITPGKIGRVLAAYTLNRITKVKFSNIVPTVTIDIFTDFLGVGLLALIASILFNRDIVYVIILDVILILPFLFIVNDWFYRIVKKLLSKRNFIKNFTLFGDEYFASQSILNKPSVYLVSMLVTLPAAFFNAAALYFSLLSVGAKPRLVGSIFINSTSQLFGMVTAIPGNIGVTDGTLVALISSLFNLSYSLSSAITIMTRMATLWFGLALGFVFLIYSLKYWKKI